MQPTLSASDLVVRFRGAAALNGVSMSVHSGSITGLMGNNGAGKSTLFHAVMGLVRPLSGSVRFGDDEITGASTRKMSALGIALVPEGRHLFGDQTVLDNLRLGFLGSRGRSFGEALAETMAMFPELQDHLGRPAAALSGGQQQMVAVARALASSPKVLLLDEPFLGLAPVIVDRLHDTFVALARGGMAVVVADAAASRLMGLCDYAYILRVGEVAAEGDTKSLSQTPVARQVLMGGI